MYIFVLEHICLHRPYTILKQKKIHRAHMGTPITREDLIEIEGALSRSFSSFEIFVAIPLCLGLAYLAALTMHTQQF